MAAAVLPLLLAAAPSVAVDAAPAAHATRVAAVNRVADTVLRGERYDYRRENWRVADADGRPSWLHVRNGRLGGTSPRLGRWRIELEERGVGKQRGERRRTVLVLRSVTERAASGTVLLSRGMGGRPANAESTNVTLSGYGTTAVLAYSAT